MVWTLDHVGLIYQLPDGARIEALRDVSLTMRPGERLAVVGPNGSGKSALALCLAGLIAPSAGTVSLPDGVNEPGSDNTNWAALVFQNPDDNLIARTVTEELALTLERTESAGEAAPADILDRFRIAHLADREVTRLSGGEKQALALACAFAARRRLIVLDEPTSHLDPPSRRELLSILAPSDSGGDQTIVLITQYADEARQFPRVVQLDNGRITYDGPSTNWLPETAHEDQPFAVYPRSDPPAILTTKSLSQQQQPGWPLPPSPLEDISITIHAGDAIGLCGPIGSGKSTLAFHLAGLLPSKPGSLTREPGDDNLPVVLIQFPERQVFCPTIIGDISWGPIQKGGSKDDALAAARQLLERLQLPAGEFGRRSPFALSGGQRRRVALAGVAACDAPLYILDEPTAALDASGIAAVEALLSDWHSGLTSYLIISHDLEWLARVTNRLWVMEKGQIQFDGSWDDTDNLPPLLERVGFAYPSGR